LLFFRQASTVAQCYPPTPESGVALEDDDASEESGDDQNILEDSDVLGDEALEGDALVKSMHRRKINEDLMMMAESSPSGRDDDADAAASPAPSRESSAPQITKGSSRLFAEEDELELICKFFPFDLFFYLYLASFNLAEIRIYSVQLRGR
jgi:hypothetical protein